MDDQEFLTIKEVCEILRISRHSFYLWRKIGKAPPTVEVGRAKVLIRRADLDSYIDARAA